MKLIFTLLILLPTLALAQAPSTSVIPYSGTLFSQGKPVSQSAPVQMAFALYTDTTGLDAEQTNAAPVANRVWSSWEEAGETIGSTISVQVRNGRFLVHLGEDGQTALADSVFDQRPLSVVAWVVQGSGTIYRLPAQSLKKVPHAVTAERANSFEVTGDLKVSGKITADAGFGYVPIGTILPWDRDIRGTSNTLPLPEGWVECNGQVINVEGSPLNGLNAPDLNNQEYWDGKGKYLRGGTQSHRYNESTRYYHNGSEYAFAWTRDSGNGYYAAPFARFFNTERGTFNSYGSSSSYLNNVYFQVTAMTVVYIIRVK